MKKIKFFLAKNCPALHVCKPLCKVWSLDWGFASCLPDSNKTRAKDSKKNPPRCKKSGRISLARMIEQAQLTLKCLNWIVWRDHSHRPILLLGSFSWSSHIGWFNSSFKYLIFQRICAVSASWIVTSVGRSNFAVFVPRFWRWSLDQKWPWCQQRPFSNGPLLLPPVPPTQVNWPLEAYHFASVRSCGLFFPSLAGRSVLEIHFLD